MLFKRENELNFNCESCGSCCKHFNVNVTHLDIKRILENRSDLTVEDFVTTTFSDDKEDNESFISTYGKRNLALKKKKDSKECLFLDGNRCSIHFFKPLVCRVWPFGYENGKISWIKEHRGFIKKVCQHTMKEGSNDPEELKKLVLWHYKERKLLAKITQKWNDEKKKELDSGDTFTNIYDKDFIDFILKEISYQSDTEKELEYDELFLEKILKVFSENMRVEAITETKSSLIYEDLKDIDLSLNLYIQEQFIDSFFSSDNLEKIKNILNAKYSYSNHLYQKNKLILLLENKIVVINVINFNKFYELLPFDTKVIYNPYKIELKLLTFKEQKIEELSRLKSEFDIYMYKLKNIIETNNLFDSKYLFEHIVHNILIPTIYWINGRTFSIQEVNILKNKTDDLYSFLMESSFISQNYNVEDLKTLSLKLQDIFTKNLELSLNE